MCEAEKCGYSPAAIADFCFPIVDLGDMRRITLKRAFNTLDEKCGYSPTTIADFCFPIVDLGDTGRITLKRAFILLNHDCFLLCMTYIVLHPFGSECVEQRRVRHSRESRAV